MSRSSGSPKTANLSKSTHQQLTMYALAAGAAGVGVLALAQPVEAKIVYTATHHVIGRNSRYILDLNHDGKGDFVISNTYHCGTDQCQTDLFVEPTTGKQGVAGHRSSAGWDFAYALKGGARIGPKFHFSALYMMFVLNRGTCSLLSWCDVKNRYLGFRFEILGKIHYGWARLSTNKGGGFKATLTGYAYETIPGKAITAGKTKGPDDDDQPAPASLKAPPLRPATLGRLALGAPGLSIWRREDSVVAAPESN